MLDQSLSESGWKDSLTTITYGRSVVEYKRITGSTNDDCCRLGHNGAPDGSLCIAEEQTSGKGRVNRKWYAGCGTSLLCSILLRPKVQIPLFLYTFSAALAMRRSILDTCGIVCEVKWPNDLLIAGKKVCGILASCIWKNGQPDFIVIGSGLNVFPDATYPEKIDFQPACLDEIRSVKCGRGNILAVYLNELEKRIKLCEKGEKDIVLEEYREHCATTGSFVKVNGNRNFSGFADSVCDDGTLMITEPNGRQTRVDFGDVSIRAEDRTFLQ